MRAFAAINNNINIRSKSSSGGLFSAIADEFEVVYGVAMDSDQYGASMIRVENDLDPLRGSKYFEAKLKDTFNLVKKDLLANKKVLFTGTSCLINGLAMFLNKDYPNLLLVDVICHGVVSGKLWQEYVKYQEQKYGKLTNVNFRYKNNNWSDIYHKNDKLYIARDYDAFMQMFLHDYALRPSCYNCKAKINKQADITIGDLWGIENIDPSMNDGKGISLVIIRTDKGQKIFDRLNIKYKEIDYEDSIKYNPCENISVVYPKQRDEFYQDLNKLSFSEMITKYTNKIKINKMKKIIKMLLDTIGIKKHYNNSNYGMLFTFRHKEK